MLLGLAATRADVRQRLTEALAPFLVDAEVSTNYTLSVAQRPQDFHRLARGGCVVVRTQDPDRLVQALAHHLSDHRDPRGSLVRTDLMALVRNGHAYVAPERLRKRLPSYESALRRAGFTIVYTPWADIDVAAGELVVEEPLVPESSLEGLVALAPPRRRQELVGAAGRYRLDRWVFEGITTDPLPRPDAVVLALSALPFPARGASVVQDFTDLFERVSFPMAPVQPVEALVRVLTEQR